jgi:hypothetical protein
MIAENRMRNSIRARFVELMVGAGASFLVVALHSWMSR